MFSSSIGGVFGLLFAGPPASPGSAPAPEKTFYYVTGPLADGSYECRPGVKVKGTVADVAVKVPANATLGELRVNDEKIDAKPGVGGTYTLEYGKPDDTVEVQINGTFLDCKSLTELFEQSAEDPPRKEDLDSAAAVWWRDHGAVESSAALARLAATGLARPIGRRLRERERRNTSLLVHLPSGAPAAPFPSSIQEATVLQVAVIVPKNHHESTYEINVKSCANVETFRTTLSADGERGDTVTKEGVDDPPSPVDFELIPIGPWLRCGAGELQYEVTVTNSGKSESSAKVRSTSLRVRGVYHLAAVAILGFDSAKLTTFETNATPGGGAVIAGTYDRNGLSLVVGGQWMIGGVDYEDMRWYNYFANVFVGVEAAHALQGTVVGIAVTPTGGISLALGMSIHKNRRLTGGRAVGDTFDGEGDIPSELSWRKPALGAFLGLTVDHRVYTALKAKFR